MLGAIIGDIVGSIYEFDNIKTKEFEFFQENMELTDDSVMTLAVAKALMDTLETGNETGFKNLSREISEEKLKLIQNKFGSEINPKTELEANAILRMVEIGNKYPHMSYGTRFRYWLEEPVPYNSFGNGSAMRVSPVAYIGKNIEEVKFLSREVTKVSHNHEEGIKGAEATAVAIFMAKKGSGKEEIKSEMEKYYSLDFNYEDLVKNYGFDETCQGTVPEAIYIFLESEDFEDAIRTAISIGGDSDTLAAIVGSIAEAYYTIPDAIREKALSYMDSFERKIYDEFEKLINKEED
ncbi:ADP-ribosylglycohydrolase family protein [Peptoniphilus sp.]|uniref:ADP-ribosylglycohydrolase family protein n=1 Tax=Peptoniphilus sp. TaxID=1971214 RepID=UPI003995597E